jgi:RNA polymerase sigma-70 factor (ECF subfamily)
MDPESLLAHRDFVRALARSLLSDEDRAEDVAQETCLAALERPPRRGGRIRPWLATVARNLARNFLRSESRRAVRERRAARPESVPSTEEVFEREAARRRVVEAVVLLEEPYRAAILLRYYEGLPPREIARRLDLPVETVRTRVKRGLQALREALDARHGGSRANWVSTLLPLAAPMAKTWFVPSLAGAFAMKTSVKATAVVLLAVAGFVAWKEWRPPDTTSTLAVAPPARPLPDAPEAQPSGESPRPPSPRAPAERTALVGRPPEISGRVEDDRGVPIQGARVDAGGESAVTDAAGRFRIAGVRESEVEVRATNPGHFDARAGWREDDDPDREVVLRLDRRLFLAGVVLDARDEPVEGARIGISRVVQEVPPSGDRVPKANPPKTGADGRFELRPLRPSLYRLRGTAPRGWVRDEEIDLTDSMPGLVLRVEDDQFRVAGRVLDCVTGEALDGVRFSCEAIVGGWIEASFGGFSLAKEGMDPSGSFGSKGWFRSFSEKRESRVVLTLAGREHEPKVLWLSTGVRVWDGLELCLVRRRAGKGRIEGRLRFDDGTSHDGPLAVRVFRPDPAPALPGSEPESRDTFATRGSFVLEDLDPGDLVAWPVVPGEVDLKWEMARILHVDPFATTRAEWTVPRGGDVRVEARHEDGRPVAGFRVVLENEARLVVEEGKEGAALLRGVPPGAYRVKASSPSLLSEESTVSVERGAEVPLLLTCRSR